ncbi:MAG: 6,7-dimethyl-8-ribityllumazine synthase [Muribaculaceae bacterium]|nr:6,7-dimethyl-8-ribityllumazine synthase [Muribaculaceae bacterium]
MSQSKPVSALPAISEDARVAIARAEWNDDITSALAKSAVETLKAAGVADDNIHVYDVPGAVELTFAASALVETDVYDAIIVFGCVVRGGTPHFDYVCQSVTQGITALNADCDTPIIFGVLTVDTHQDAVDRIAGGAMGDKGAEAAEAAVKMIAFRDKVNEIM